MGLRLLRFTSIMSTAVSMTAALAHLFEMPAKMHYDPRLYVKLHRTLYWNFGKVGGIAEVVAVISTGVLTAIGARQRSNDVPLTAAAAGSLAAAHGVFWAKVQPANNTMLNWPLDAIPSEWERWRNQWEYTHAGRAVLITGALGALAASAVREPVHQRM